MASSTIKINSKFNEICNGISQNRQFLEDLLKQHSLDVSPDLIAHLFLLLNSLTKSSSSTLLASMKSCYSDDVIKTLMNIAAAAADGKTIKMLQSNKTSSCANDDAACERLDEVCNNYCNLIKKTLRSVAN